eukprot:7300963-Prymnesium_polylepis.1
MGASLIFCAETILDHNSLVQAASGMDVQAASGMIVVLDIGIVPVGAIGMNVVRDIGIAPVGAIGMIIQAAHTRASMRLR